LRNYPRTTRHTRGVTTTASITLYTLTDNDGDNNNADKPRKQTQ
jgi:hypothetical protein